jgi:hypothetical protein
MISARVGWVELPPSCASFFNADENDRKAKVVVLGYGIAQDLFGADVEGVNACP